MKLLNVTVNKPIPVTSCRVNVDYFLKNGLKIQTFCFVGSEEYNERTGFVPVILNLFVLKYYRLSVLFDYI